MFTRDITRRIITVGDIVYSTYSDAKYKVEDICPNTNQIYVTSVVSDDGIPEIKVGYEGQEYTPQVFVCSNQVSLSKKLANRIIRIRNIWSAITRMGKYQSCDINDYNLHYYLHYDCGIKDEQMRNEIIDTVIARVCHESTRLHT